ncbi:MAG: ligD [Myxococcaceae bacterium]|nr:ligD [Myxococcaceae bacterium]
MPKAPRPPTARPASSGVTSSHPGIETENKTAGAPLAPTPSPALRFVVQKHETNRLYYAVRLEIAGTLTGWAVPKGPSYDPRVKRVAVQIEDHPLAFADFEGRITEGRGDWTHDVLIWDRGSYETVPPDAAEAMRAKGHFRVRLFGEKLQGEWHLVKTRSTKQWLFFKATDTHANANVDIVAERPESIVTGKSATSGPVRVNPSPLGKTAKELLALSGDVAKATSGPMLAHPSEYTFEIKYDGYRLLAGKSQRDVRLVSRRSNDWTDRFRPIAEAISRLPALEAVIDGEACAVDANGTPSFGRLQQWLAGEKVGSLLAFAAFDLLWLDGHDLRKLPLESRRQLLENLLVDAKPPLCFSAAIDGDLPVILAAAKKAGLEGLVAKRKGSIYVAGPTTSWLKLKFEQRQDCAVCGWTPQTGSNDLGALILGLMEEGQLVYAGKAGSGFDDKKRKELVKRLEPLRTDKPTLVGHKSMPDARWCKPELVAEIAFMEYSRHGNVRNPVFVALREDKTPEECFREEPAPLPLLGDDEAIELPPASMAPISVKLSNPDKVLYPKDGITKRAILDYYTQVAPFLLPHLAGRPINFQRWVDGIHDKEWFQHNVPAKPPTYVRRISFDPSAHSGRRASRIVVDNVATLQWLVNFAALTLHMWTSHTPESALSDAAVKRALAMPDFIVLDLDPSAGCSWKDTIEVALAIRTLLEALELPSVVKTSGQKGLHILVPLARGHTHEVAFAFAEQIARAVARVLPTIATVERSIEKRERRVYVDYVQNGQGRTIVAPYSLRAMDGAPVSTPLLWSEVSDKLDPSAFTLRTILARIEAHGDLFAGALSGTAVLPRS